MVWCGWLLTRLHTCPDLHPTTTITCLCPHPAPSPATPHHTTPLAVGASIELAASHGAVVAVATTSHLTLLAVDPVSGALSSPTGHLLPLSSPPSALALLHTPPPLHASSTSASNTTAGPGVPSGLHVAVGHWIDNCLVVLRVEAGPLATQAPGKAGPGSGSGPAVGAEVCRLDLGDQTPRSAAVCCWHGQWLLLVGSNTGQVVMFPFVANSTAAGGAAPAPLLRWQVGPASSVSISNVAVELLPCSGAAATAAHGTPQVEFVYAHSGSGAVIKPLARLQGNAAAAGTAAAGGLVPTSSVAEVLRVHGAERLVCCSHVATEAMAHGSMAWVAHGDGGGADRLLFGWLDKQLALRWTTAFIGACGQILPDPARSCRAGDCAGVPVSCRGVGALHVMMGTGRPATAAAAAGAGPLTAPWSGSQPRIRAAWRGGPMPRSASVSADGLHP